ncbi:MAG: hypothetical protein EXX96DRAFT_483052 [Benjaminiella poitrasii]|nr:MAG: hypothetical protein EXX96DRAFT_483052 [Benjaminiella poitrasii]
MTPSFGYQAQQQSSTFTTNNNDLEFSPLSSPAILPHQKQAANVDNGDTFDNNLSAKQIREKYEELEHAKQILTQKLTELQKTQRQPQPYYYNDNSQQSTMSTESSSSNTNFFTHNNGNYGASQSLPSSYIEPATPASLMNIRSTSQSSYSSFSQPIPPSPLTLLPTSEMSAKSSTKNEKRSNKKQRQGSSDAASKSKSNSGIAHTPTRALKPLLISPTLKPGHSKTLLPNNKKMPIPSINHEIQSVEEAERILATRSNYQNLIEGKAAALGIDFSTQIKSGIEIRRTAHKAAEQKRRDSLKEWFDRLRCEVEEGYVKRQRSLLSQVIIAQALEKRTGDHQGNDSYDASSKTRSDSNAMKPLSKVLLLQYAYEYITSLKQTLQEKDTLIEKLKATSIHNVNEADHNTKKRKADGNCGDKITKNLE